MNTDSINTATRNRFFQSTLLCIVLLMTTACAQLNTVAPVQTVADVDAPNTLHLFADKGRFGTPPKMAGEADLFELSDAQRADFLQYMDDPRFADRPKYKRLYDYLEQSTYNFNYRGQTYLAREAIASQQGNCLSLAIMTTALARTVGVRVAYQLIDTTPVFEVGDNAIAKGVHVRSKLYRTDLEKSKATDIITMGSAGIVVDYFPSNTKRFIGNISEQNFIARYYRNLAVEQLQNADYSSSYWHALKSMDYAPEDAEGLNLMAVIFKRSGFINDAERIYQHGINIASSKLSLLKNYRQLLNEQGRHREATRLTRQIAEIDDPSPYNWLQVADAMLAEKNYKEALNYYNRAVHLAPYLQYGYLGMAKAYYFQGRIQRSEAMLQKAIERNYDRDNDELYQAKLAALASS